MYGATGAIGSSPIASSAIAATGHSGYHALVAELLSISLGLNAATITPTYILSRIKRSGAIGARPIASLPIAASYLSIGTVLTASPANFIVVGGSASFVGNGRIKACFHWGSSASVSSYWNVPTTVSTFAVPTVAYGFSVGPKNFKVVKTNAEIRAGQ